MKKALCKTVILIIVFSLYISSFAGTITSVDTLVNQSSIEKDNMSPSMTFEAHDVRMVDINYIRIDSVSNDLNLQSNINTYLKAPLTTNTINCNITLTQAIEGSHTLIQSYISNFNNSWRDGAERYFIYHNNALVLDFTNSTTFKNLQNFCEQNGIKLISVSDTANQITIKTVILTLANSFSFTNANMQTTLSKVASIISNEKSADIFINVGVNSYTDSQIQNAIDGYLKPKMLNNNITANININYDYSATGKPIKKVLTINGTTFYLMDNGDLYVKGTNSYGLLGVGSTNTAYSITNPSLILSNVKDICSGGDTVVLALKNDGILYTWGKNYMYGYDDYAAFHVLGYGTVNEMQTTPKQCLTGISKIYSGNGKGWMANDGSRTYYMGWLVGQYVGPNGSSGTLRSETSPNSAIMFALEAQTDTSSWKSSIYSNGYRGWGYTTNLLRRWSGGRWMSAEIQSDLLWLKNDSQLYIHGSAPYIQDIINANDTSGSRFIIKGSDGNYYRQLKNQSRSNVNVSPYGWKINIDDKGYAAMGGDSSGYVLTQISYTPPAQTYTYAINYGLAYDVFGADKSNGDLLPYLQSINSTSFNTFTVDITNILRSENVNSCSNALKLNNSHFIGINNNAAKPFTDAVLSSNNYKGTNIDDSDINTDFDQLADYIITNIQTPVKSNYVLLNEPVSYNKVYSDPELDPISDEIWNYSHNVNYFTNSLGIITDTSGLYTGISGTSLTGVDIHMPIIQFDKVGKYHVGVKAKDNPFPIRSSISRWGNVYYQDIIVHRRPIADFNYTATYDSDVGKFIPTFVDYSYDLDHSNLVSKGIDKRVWKWRLSTATAWTIGIPLALNSGSSYDVSLEVQDLEGAWSYAKIVTINTVNIPPDIIANPVTATSESAISVNLFATDPENQVKNIKWSVTNSALKPSSYTNATINYAGTKSLLAQIVTISSDGTWFINAEVEDQTGNKTYKTFGAYIIQSMKIYDFTVNMIYDLNWHSYYYNESSGVDTDSDGIIDSYTRNSDTDIKTLQMPINNPQKVTSSISVKAGVKTEGYVDIIGTPDTAYFKSNYMVDGVMEEDVISLGYDSVTGHYYWDYTIPEDVDQETFIYFDVYAIKGGTTYGNEKWVDFWDVENSERYVFYVEGSVRESLRVHQRN